MTELEHNLFLISENLAGARRDIAKAEQILQEMFAVFALPPSAFSGPIGSTSAQSQRLKDLLPSQARRPEVKPGDILVGTPDGKTMERYTVAPDGITLILTEEPS